MGLSALMALATPVEKHMAESALPSLRNVKHVLSQHTGSGSTHRIWVNTQQKHSFEGSTTFAAGGEACSVFTALRVHHVSESCVHAEQVEQGMLELQHS